MSNALDPAIGSRWRHIENGIVVEVIMRHVVGMPDGVVYRDEIAGTVWLRPLAEFTADRFVSAGEVDAEEPASAVQAAQFRFGWYPSEVTVECPPLERFIADIKDVCRRHGAGFKLNLVWSEMESSSMVIVPFDEAAFDWLTSDLDKYEGGVPWLSAAKAEWQRLADARLEDADRKHALDVERCEREEYERLKARFEPGA